MSEFLEFPDERVTTRCVCCGGDRLQRSPAILMPFVADRALGWPPVRIDASWGLRTIPEGYGYTVCNSLYCEACDFLFLDIRFSDREMARLYADYQGEAYARLRDHYEPGFLQRNVGLRVPRRHTREIEHFLRLYLADDAPTILDWGGGEGRNSPFRESSRRLDIYEIYEAPVLAPARLVTNASELPNDYDLITCNQVLEHVPYPSRVLGEIRRCMNAATLLYVEVPYEDVMRHSPADGRVSTKRHWHEHINFYSPQALRALLEHSGFSVVTVDDTDIDTGERIAGIVRALARLAP